MYLALRQKKKFSMLYDYLHISVLGAFNTSDSLVIRDIMANIGMYIVMETILHDNFHEIQNI